MSLKNSGTSTKVVIYQTGNKREAERKFQVKYSAWTILLVLLGKSLSKFRKISGPWTPDLGCIEMIICIKHSQLLLSDFIMLYFWWNPFIWIKLNDSTVKNFILNLILEMFQIGWFRIFDEWNRRGGDGKFSWNCFFSWIVSFERWMHFELLTPLKDYAFINLNYCQFPSLNSIFIQTGSKAEPNLLQYTY